MEKIALITDSASDISLELQKRYNVFVLPFRIIYKDKEYIDGIDITPKFLYDTMENETVTTSLPSMQDMERLFERLKNEGYTEAIFFTISSNLSGTNNAIKLVCEEYPEIRCHVYDTLSISYGETVPLIEVGKMIEEGKSFDTIIEELPKISEKVEIFFVIGTLEYLIRGGRIGKVAGTIAQFLQIKPIISVGKDGVYYTHSKARGRKQSLNKIYDIGLEKLNKKKHDIYIAHGHSEEEGIAIAEKFRTHSNARNVIFAGDISVVSGVHTGPGFLGVLFYEVE